MRLSKKTFFGPLVKFCYAAPVTSQDCLTLVASSKGIRAVLWNEDVSEPGLTDTLSAIATVEKSANPHIEIAVRQFDEYFAGRRSEFEIDLDMDGTAFQLSAWAALRTIPFGETISYGMQATGMGSPRLARAVGAANRANPISVIVPCHRVIGKNGDLTGFAGGMAAKSWLLQHEQKVASPS